MKLTIIIPVYNKIRYLAGLLEQLREQTFRDFECLLIDDGSTDGSGVVCDEFAARDPRLRVFHIPNGGVSHARNVGLDNARGEYVTFVDADDRIHGDLLERLYGHAEKSGAAIVIGNLQKVWDDREDVVPQPMPYQGLYSMEELLPDFARVQRETGIYGFCVAKLLRRDLIADTRFDCAVRLAEDLNFYLDIYPRIDTIYFDPEPRYDYLQAAENSSMLDADDRIDYLAQLRINLHYRAMLRQRGAYAGENQSIVEGRLDDYAYFVLFHTPLEHYRERFERLYQLCTEQQVPLAGGNALRRWLFFCLRRRQCLAARLTMTLYRLARSLLRR